MSSIHKLLVASLFAVPMLAMAADGSHQSTGKAGAGTAPQAKNASSLRFNMTQNGKHMSADEFDAWMKSRGVRVAKGGGNKSAPKPAAPAAPVAETKAANDG